MAATQRFLLALLLAFCSWYLVKLSIIQSTLNGFVLFVTLNWYFDTKQWKDLPPGRVNVSNVSAFFKSIRKENYENVDALHQKYGPIVTASFNRDRTPMICVGEYKTMKELSVHPDIKEHSVPLLEVDPYYGIVQSVGLIWKHQRRFLLHYLRNVGMGKLKMQEKVQQELSRFMTFLEGTENTSTALDHILPKTISNTICSLTFGKQFEYDDEELNTLINTLTNQIYLVSIHSTMEQFSFLAPLLYFLRMKIASNNKTVHAILDKIIQEHKETLDPNHPRDLIDEFLLQMKDIPEKGQDEYHSTFSEKQLEHLIRDLFVAGTETSAVTTSWALLFMIRNPDIQEKVRKEIGDVVGFERYPGMEDIPNLPFTTATLQEVERMGTISPESLPRTNKRPFRYEDIVIPSNSTILFSLYSVLRDPAIFKDPFKFNPYRFIDSDGNAFRPPELCPFGSGKRRCAGEALGRMQIFLYFATLIQNFVFEPVDKAAPPSTEAQGNQLRRPCPYKIRCFRRKFYD